LTQQSAATELDGALLFGWLFGQLTATMRMEKGNHADGKKHASETQTTMLFRQFMKKPAIMFLSNDLFLNGTTEGTNAQPSNLRLSLSCWDHGEVGWQPTSFFVIFPKDVKRKFHIISGHLYSEMFSFLAQ
jgi:hypothetical protein